jgi:hypothetical protein
LRGDEVEGRAGGTGVAPGRRGDYAQVIFFRHVASADVIENGRVNVAEKFTRMPGRKRQALD